WTTHITQMVGLRTPLVIYPLQAFVTEPLKPWLNNIVVSASLHIYVSQSSRGELITGASLDPYEVISQRSTLEFAEDLCAHMLDLFPCLGDVKVLRQWAGLSDMTPDFSPIMGTRPAQEFSFGGELRAMPDPNTATDEEWADYVFNRSGEPGVKREWWYHIPSGIWFVAERDNRTDTFLRTYLFDDRPRDE